MKKYRLGIVGATGLVGREFIKVIEEYKLNISLKLFASKKSEGKKLLFNNEEIEVRALNANSFDDLDFVLFSAGSKISRIYAPLAAKNSIVIDNSSYFRMNPSCALIVPEINFEDYKKFSKIIANPNCSTIQCVMVLKPLDDEFDLKKVVYSTYQSVSGGGQKLVSDFSRCRNGLNPNILPYDLTKNLIPEIDEPSIVNYTKEEIKMIQETRKILNKPDLLVSSTCVRVPIIRTHAVTLYCEFKKEVDIDKVYEILSNTIGIKVLDDLDNHIYPLGEKALGNDLVYVGRIRKTFGNKNGLLLYVVSDNLRKGASSNAVQILKRIIEDKEKNK